MLFHSPEFITRAKDTLATTLAIITVLPGVASAATLTHQIQYQNQQLAPQTTKPSTTMPFNSQSQPSWLIADDDDDDDDDNDGRRRHNRNSDDDDDDDKKRRRVHDQRAIRIDLNRAKNLARQAAEQANGGIRVYRAENSMHGPAHLCPHVDNGDHWTFTFLGGRPGVTTRTIESVIKVYKNTSRVVVAYNGSIRSVQQTQIVSFNSNQRTVLVDLLRGNCGCNYLLTNALRTQIISQSRSLPPGIQKQLLRGKGLPPGIAKKLVRLPKQVNTYINLPTQYDLIVVGSNVVLLEQTRSIVVDLITNVL